MTDVHDNLLWYGEYTAWGRLKKDNRVYNDAALNLDGTIRDKHRGIPHSPKMIEISYFAKDGKHNGILKTINKVSKN